MSNSHTPRDYIRLASELHLNCTWTDEVLAQIDSFLTTTASSRFLVWKNAETEATTVSTDAIPKELSTSKVLVFVKNKAEVTDAEDLQCLTLQDVSTLSLYARECFLPFVNDETCTTKVRELEVALAASTRSTRLPHVVLAVHDAVSTAEDSAALGDEVLNEIQNNVKDWIVQIRKVTDLADNTPFDDDHELAFWNSLGSELSNIQDQLSSDPAIQKTLNILRESKRFVATVALENNTGLEHAVTVATDVNQFLKNLNLPQLQAARDFNSIVSSGAAIFEQLTKIRASRYYSLERSIQLVSFITTVLSDAVQETLENMKNWTNFSFKEYETKVRFPVTDVFSQLDDWIAVWQDFTLDLARRRKLPGIGRLLESMPLNHKSLQQRLDQIHDFRSNHEQLRSVVHAVLRQEEPEALQHVEQAPRQFWNSVTDVYKDEKSFQAALSEYDLQMDALEERLARLLREKLQACNDAEDMFRVFARFNLLLTRPRVRAAVKEFQLQLISTVASAIGKLQSKFTHKYETSSAARISRLRGIPPVSGKILWAKQMERQVNTLMERMGNVLGQGWGQQLEGRQLRKSGDELLAKLDARSFFRNWVLEWEKGLVANSKRNSYPIIVDEFAKVNFDEKNEVLSKEIRHLKWLGFGKDIPRTLTTVGDEANNRYPFAIAIKTALRSYHCVRFHITPELEPLVMPQLLEIRECIAEAFDVKLSTSTAVSKKRRIRWDTPEMGQFVTRLTEAVTKFEERVEQLLESCDKVDAAIGKLDDVPYEEPQFRSVLDTIQETIDTMSLSGFSNLESWVKVVCERMAKVLSMRLEGALKAWNHKFKAAEGAADEEKDDAADEVPESIPSMDIESRVNVEIVLRNQEISSAPAIPTVRKLIQLELQKFIGVVCGLPKPKGGRYEVFDSGTTNEEEPSDGESESFDNLVSMISAEVFAEAQTVAEGHLAEATSFSEQWLSYQTLWDTQVADVAGSVGSDIEKWQSLLREASEARSTLDASASMAEFGPVVVNYAKVQSQILLKYDSWQKELQASFAQILGQCVHETHEKITKAKANLEELTLDSASTETIVLGVTFIQEMKQKIGLYDKEIDNLRESERVLKRQRHVFSGDWMETSVVKGLCGSLHQILDRRARSMEQQVPVLQARVSAEDKSATKKLAELIQNWEEEKPLRGNLTPPEAIASLAKFELTMKKAHVHQENLVRAKDALGLEDTVERTEVVERLNELADLKEVWESMMLSHETLEQIKSTPWSSAVMRKVRRSLDDLLASMRSLPNRIRQYDAYTHLHDIVKGYIGGHTLLSDLKSEALKERHWKTILQRLGIHLPFSDLTVGLLWDKGILTRKKEVGEILVVAQGEMALEVFLSDVRDRWMKRELELVLFQNRTRLIRGWDELFATLDDHIGGLALMKSSPYYRSVREFQEEGNLWEDRLTKLRAAFDSWVDVQRRWVYLEGILFGSSDIKAQLPTEYSRFKSVDGEFIALMRRITSKPYAMEVLNIDNLQRTLERLGNLMNVIQRALGEYLSKQRSDFSRFYFLGDDDLLEIMGNAGEPGKVLQHVGKMFAGIAGARLHTENLPDGIHARLDAMLSKDGEVVEFHQPIDIPEQANVKSWLKDLESTMQKTLALLLEEAVKEDQFSSQSLDEKTEEKFVQWTTKFPAQVMILATQVNWSMGVDRSLSESDSQAGLQEVVKVLEWKLKVMANTVLHELPPEHRKKFEQLITELVHQRDVVRSLIEENVNTAEDFRWLYHLRYNYNPKADNIAEKLVVSLSNAQFYYGFEYLGIGERLVQTPLTDRCFLTLTQALHFRMGGSPFGPAGTGKTESVKALGAALGRFVLVFNCDETFDFSAMGRLLAGLSQVGAWGCFDEFNRLEERILSAVSQQILTIQRGLLDREQKVELLGRSVTLHENVGIFITMNPGYEGRSNLPDNLKSLFRSFAMVVPDRNLIAQVMLYSQGIVTAEQLAGKVVSLFMLCQERMSKQRHYDFGLRALKTLLVSAGALKRQAMEGKGALEGDDLASVEKDSIIVGACNNVLPKLVANDLSIFTEVLEEVFPGSQIAKMDDGKARTEIADACKQRQLVASESFIQKVLQLKQVIESRHGVMVVGKAGKTSALRVLLQILEKLDGIKGDMYVIDPKAISKEKLYGSLDGTTLEWTDGVVTSLLRRIIDNQKGESERRHWIVFDGDVDPNWCENLNSVLDDNKMLTLPSGERMSIPSNVRIILEVDSLAHATPATVSRCGMVWFSDDSISTDMTLQHLLATLEVEDFSGNNSGDQESNPAQMQFLNTIRPMVISGERTSSLVVDGLEFALKEDHVMAPDRDRLLHTLKAMLHQGISLAVEYDENHPDFPMVGEHMEKFAQRWLLHSLMWSFCGSATWDTRRRFSDMLVRTSGVLLPGGSDMNLFDYRVKVGDGEYELWSDSVPRMEIESHRAAASDVIITTTDTVRHSDVLGAWLSLRIPLVLCGPPGSGKTMSLTSVLQSIQGVILANLNFSSRTTPEIILKTFAQYCSYVRRGKDIFLEPSDNLGGAQSWLVVFCDEINLPEEDTYGTQRVIMFMRQLVEHGGFWRDDNMWIKISRIQFVGACNPPTDAGRVTMSHRFLRHVPLLLVDFPAKDSLMQIYGTFNSGMLKLFPNLKGENEAITEAMVGVYLENQSKFKPHMQPQYFYSPRELSRWVRGVYEAIVNMDGLTKEELVRIWAHEGLRLFGDRLVDENDRQWCSDKIDEIAKMWFAGVDFETALARPMFFTTWLSKDTKRVERDELKEFLSARLRVFYEEELDVPLVVFDGVLDHVLRIDRVLRQPMGHLLLVGDSGAGKTVLSKFVSWMNGLNIFQIKAHSRYTMEDFNEDLRTVMRRVGVEGEKVCFIFDESNVLSSGFIEAINALLASGEVPGLFEGDEYTALMTSVRDSAARDGIILDSDEEIWRHFTSIVQRNLHVVFTVNPSGGDWKNRSTTSPALFNRCVVDWFGTWDNKAMAEVGKEFTQKIDMGNAESDGGVFGIGNGEDIMKLVDSAFDGNKSLRQAVVASMVSIHQITTRTAAAAAAEASSITRTFLSPRDYLTMIQNFVSCLNGRREQVEDEQLHVNAGLEKLRQTQENVADLKSALRAKGTELREKEALANKKLQEMVADQNIAEKRKDEAEKMSIQVEKQQLEISTRKVKAQGDLDEAEPALKSAQSSVRGIKKRDLDEVRNLARPPNNVKLTLECVAILLGEKKVEWTDVRKLLSKNDFISSIIEFDADKLSSKQIKLVTDKYLDGNLDLTVESVTRSSKACGPLYQWAESQVMYSRIYNSIAPLRDEVEQLEKEAKVAKEEKESIEQEVQKLEDSIAKYKVDYAALIRDVEALKAEMNSVTTKVTRAESLLTSLSRESDRWSKSSETFQTIMKSLVGDGLLMAAFLTYAGFFDFKTRSKMIREWKETLDVVGIEFREDLGIVETLSTAAQRLAWQEQGLPGDQLSLENGVIIDRGIRFPLVIDPSGQAISFLMNKYRDEKIQTTSFVDKAFTKTLAGAVRFGTTLLVENVEKIDPILNPILNRELQRTGGRTLVRIGPEEVDYSPKFRIILSTKNPAVELTPDLCSRVTLVNFTVTPDSLESQSLSQVVKSMKPELESQRASLLKLQGEQNVKLRELEEKMLAMISACEGSILDDDAVVEGMEVLMKEGSQVEEQISHSAEVMGQVRQAVAQFEPFAATCRQIFVLLEALRDLSFLYEFPASSFMGILENILLKNAKSESSEESARIGSLKKMLFATVAARIGRGLQVNDKIVFSILLARLDKGDKTIGSEMVQSSDEYVTEILASFGADFPWQGRALSDLAEVTNQEVDATVPLMLCSAPGHDVSGRVESMARELKKNLSAVAMGSSEGFDTAEALVATASKQGTWVMLKNVHLCVEWLRDTLVKKIQSFGPTTHKDFRLFITSEINPRLPTGLLRISDTIVAEAPTGIQATLNRFLSSIPKNRFESPVRNRLYFLLGWLHCVIQERLRFVPEGWTEAYEWTEADATHGLDVIDSLVGTGERLDPEKLPWDAMRATLRKGVYGGRITETVDQTTLDDLVDSIFVAQAFDVEFKLVPKVSDGPVVPEGSTRADILSWCQALGPAPPTWVGLGVSAEAEREKRLAASVLEKVTTIQAKSDVES